MRTEKAGMPSPTASDIAISIKRHVVMEDLTRDSLRLLKSLAADERVGEDLDH
jgi:hypothetical protein